MIEQAIGLEAKNSLEYVRHAFTVLNRGGLFVNIASNWDPQQATNIHIQSTLTVASESGWYQGPAYTGNRSEEGAQILFTSGTEGLPKGVLLSHRALKNTTDRIISVMEMDASVREYVGIPVNYSFGFGRCRAVSQIGGEFYLPENGFNPVEIQEMLERGEINAISAVPSLWRLILENPQLLHNVGDKVRWIEIGSQYMSAEEKSQLRNLFPNACIAQHYGLSEASRTTFLRVDTTPEEQLESVGTSSNGVELRISTTGAIQIRGPHIASAILIDGQKEPLVDSDGWFTTNDQGHEVDGLLYFDGRMDDLINCGGIKLSPDSLEQALLKRLSLKTGIAIFKLAHADLGDQPALAISNQCKCPNRLLADAFRQILAESGVRGSSWPLFNVESFPQTSTGKVKRKELTKLASSGALGGSSSIRASNAEGKNESTPSEKRLIAIWEEVLKVHPICAQDNFFDLGGDSLSAIRVATRMEKSGIPREVSRKIFSGLSISQILESMESDTAAAPKSQSAPENTLAKDLIAIWQDVLKLDQVGENETFFGLGGDSLSAIRVALRMEKAGVPKETCKKIFQGFTIKQIVSQTEGRDAPSDLREVSAQDTSTQPHVMETQLIEIWQDALKIDNIGLDDNFFDLGGDSLSAIRVTIRMEAAGLERTTCRKIFEGMSIRQILDTDPEFANKRNSYTSESPKNSTATPPANDSKAVSPEISENFRTPMASASLALNAMRGLLVLMNIAAHWVPGVIDRLPALAGQLNRYLAPVYSSGTPGFAIVFGAGIGFFMLPRFDKNRRSVDKLAIRNVLLLIAGMTALALVRVSNLILQDVEVSSLDVSNAYYSVIFYYLFAVISIPLWLRVLRLFSAFSMTCLTVACVFYFCHLAIDATEITPSSNALIQPWILLLTAKYNYLEMSAGVLAGAAIGNALKHSIERGDSLAPYAHSGALLVLLSIIISLETGEYVRWFDWPKGLYLWTWPFYLGCILLGTVGIYNYLCRKKSSEDGIADSILRILSVVGILAFPLFIGHELVRPTAQLITALGAPMGLAISMTAFFALSLYMGQKLYAIYFGSGVTTPAVTPSIPLASNVKPS
ncbi:phosphopantetheine-binding protein [Microbulbifer aggregans]|uniref:phosphopantetheine-binding protein n=1 Tax=Microbulbifer aggregans TaxID=1769779 RepID=UPI001CFD8FC6|nr:phosphopantetheine-binding protein [Microbulbifer aggregans]